MTGWARDPARQAAECASSARDSSHPPKMPTGLRSRDSELRKLRRAFCPHHPGATALQNDISSHPMLQKNEASSTGYTFMGQKHLPHTAHLVMAIEWCSHRTRPASCGGESVLACQLETREPWDVGGRRRRRPFAKLLLESYRCVCEQARLSR